MASFSGALDEAEILGLRISGSRSMTSKMS